MKILPEGRITPRELKKSGVPAILDKMRRLPGYYLTNTERDLSQSDFKNRIMPHTQILVAPERNAAGYFHWRSPAAPRSMSICCASR